MSTISTALVSSSPQVLSTYVPSRSTSTPPTATTTPSTPSAAKPPTPKPSPGTFRHPRLTEIISRQSRATLKEINIRSATINAAAIILSFIFSADIHDTIGAIFTLTSVATPGTAKSITSTTILILRLLFLLNTVLSLRPILPYISQKDDVTDIPLTPSQRALLGLPPSKPTTPLSTQSSPVAGTSGYITPPRYQRQFSTSSSSTGSNTPDYPGTDRRSISGNYSSSPLSTSRYTLGFSPSPNTAQTQAYPRNRTASGSPFSPTASPLFQKAIRHQYSASQERDFDISARSSLGPLNQSLYTSSTNSFNGPSTPSPSALPPIGLPRPLGLPGGLAQGLGLGRSQSVKERSPTRGGIGSGDAAQNNNISSLAAAGSSSATGSGTSAAAQKGVNYKWLYDKGFSRPLASGSGSGSGSAGKARAGLVKSDSMHF